MAQAEPITRADSELLQSLLEQEAQLAPPERRQLTQLARELATIAELPLAERSGRCQQIVSRADVEILRASVERAQHADKSREDASELDALVVKLAACLPPRSGG